MNPFQMIRRICNKPQFTNYEDDDDGVGLVVTPYIGDSCWETPIEKFMTTVTIILYASLSMSISTQPN